MILGEFYVSQQSTPVAERRRRFGWCKDINNAPVVKRIILLNNKTMAFIASTYSRSSDGYWEVKGLPTTIPDYSILTVAIDDTRTYESVVRDHKSLVV